MCLKNLKCVSQIWNVGVSCISVALHRRHRWSNILCCLPVKQVTLVHQPVLQLKSRHIEKYQQVGPMENYTVSETQLEALLGRQQPSNCLTCIQNTRSHILWRGPPPLSNVLCIWFKVCAFEIFLSSLVFSTSIIKF